MKGITLVIGGRKSGKSNYALSIARKYNRKLFIATGEAVDKEMRDRIENHKSERGDDFVTVEEPLNPAKSIRSSTGKTDVIVLDCISFWLNNLLFTYKESKNNFKELNSFFKTLQTPHCPIIIVSSEVGFGITAANSLSGNFSDLLGDVNQKIAEIADQVFMTVCGIPLLIKNRENKK